jgi:hypothetical protein
MKTFDELMKREEPVKKKRVVITVKPDGDVLKAETPKPETVPIKKSADSNYSLETGNYTAQLVEKRATAANPTLTKEGAIAKYYRENPAIYEQYKKELAFDRENYKNTSSAKIDKRTPVEKRVDSMAADLMKSDTKLTKAAAISRIYKENPQVYAEYQKKFKA